MKYAGSAARKDRSRRHLHPHEAADRAGRALADGASLGGAALSIRSPQISGGRPSEGDRRSCEQDRARQRAGRHACPRGRALADADHEAIVEILREAEADRSVLRDRPDVDDDAAAVHPARCLGRELAGRRIPFDLGLVGRIDQEIGSDLGPGRYRTGRRARDRDGLRGAVERADHQIAAQVKRARVEVLEGQRRLDAPAPPTVEDVEATQLGRSETGLGGACRREAPRREAIVPPVVTTTATVFPPPRARVRGCPGEIPEKSAPLTCALCARACDAKANDERTTSQIPIRRTRRTVRGARSERRLRDGALSWSGRRDGARRRELGRSDARSAMVRTDREIAFVMTGPFR